ncbi:MAG: DNA-binding response regulator, partial [Chloroflexi bacterium]
MLNRPSTILLMENDVNLAVSLIIGLQDQGYRALHASDGHLGLKMARTAQPDLILLDVKLPRMDGFAVCRTLRRASAVPIILLTARGQERERIRGLELGADSYIDKPFSFRE